MTRPPFPSVLSSTIMAAFKSCPHKANLEFIQHWKARDPSVHLHAGLAFAEGLEKGRLAFFVDGKPPAEAEAIGLSALLTSYGDFPCPAESPKSAERMAGALEFYYSRYPMQDDPAVPMTLPGDKRGIEFSFLEPLEVLHPTTGDPILYSGRLDMLVDFEGMHLGEDDKTTSQLGASWPRQWDLRCFSEDTEVLTEQGWLRISVLKEGEKVAQWKEGSIEFVPATDVHGTSFQGKLTRILGRKVDQLVTGNHRIFLNKRRGGSRVVLAEELANEDQKHSIPTCGELEADVTLPDAFQQYLVAVQADGSLQYSKGLQMSGRGHREHMPFPATRFSFSKRRKYERLLSILKACDVAWTEQLSPTGIYTVHVSGFEPVQEHLMLCLDENKEFKERILPFLSKTFVEELSFWDGWASQYYTTSEHNARFVQTAAHCFGYRCSVAEKINHTRSFVMVLSKDTEALLGSLAFTQEDYTGKVWCLSVPSTFLLVRRNGVISVSGNSQFTAYVWGAQRAGIKLDGFLIRGISILKSKYDTLQAITHRPQWMIDRWYEQTHRDVKRMVRCWDEGYFDLSLDNACVEYGGCQFRNICQMQRPEPLLRQQFQRRMRDPVTREEVVLEDSE